MYFRYTGKAMEHLDRHADGLQVAGDYRLPSVSPEVMLWANEASFTLSFKIMDVASLADHETIGTIKQARHKRWLSNRGSQPWTGVLHYSLSQRQS